jgi:Fe-S cluster biogenesis protein NfuA
MSALFLGHPKIRYPIQPIMTDDEDTPTPVSETIEEAYRAQIGAAMEKEAQRRITESHDPEEIARLETLSVVDLFETDDSDLVPALMARLGPVRAALDGHGGVVARASIEALNSGSRVLSLILDLDGACVSCGAAPGTLKGIQDDLLMDSEIIAVRFTSAMLEWFDELQRDFVLKHGGVVFV